MEIFKGRFEVIRQLGAGNYFDAFRAFDPLLRRDVFIKKSRASTELVTGAIVQAQLQQWQTQAHLSLPGLPTIHDVFQENDSWFLVTEWVDIPSLRQLPDWKPGPADPRRFLFQLLRQSLVVLSDMHAHGLVHADISPGNILASPELSVAKVVMVDPAPKLNLRDPADPSRWLILCSPSFAAPEILAGHPATPSTDLFSLGKVIADASRLLHVEAFDVVGRLTAAQPDRRPQSAAEALEELRAEALRLEDWRPDIGHAEAQAEQAIADRYRAVFGSEPTRLVTVDSWPDPNALTWPPPLSGSGEVGGSAVVAEPAAEPEQDQVFGEELAGPFSAEDQAEAGDDGVEATAEVWPVPLSSREFIEGPAEPADAREQATTESWRGAATRPVSVHRASPASSRDPDEPGITVRAAPAPEQDFAESVTIIAAVPRPPLPSWSQASAAIAVPVPGLDHRAPPTPADFSVIAPNLVRAGCHFVVEVWVAPSGQREAMLQQAMRNGRMIERGGRSHVHLLRDTIITVILRLPDFELSEPVETLGWNGDIRNVGFIVKAPAALAPGIYPGSAKLLQGQIPFASILFDLEVVAAEGTINDASRPLTAHIRRIAYAFASYASEDRSEVLRRVQGIRAVGSSVFLDIVSLRSGEAWEETLYREIGASDGFFLFWSRSAARSSWVEREWRFALERRGIDFINPLALEDPRYAEPPAELRSRHFNDMLLAFIKAEEIYRDRPGA